MPLDDGVSIDTHTHWWNWM